MDALRIAGKVLEGYWNRYQLEPAPRSDEHMNQRVTAAAMLNFLNRWGKQVTFQDLTPSCRRKNRVIVSYVVPGSDHIEVVGGHNLESAVLRAQALQTVGTEQERRHHATPV